MCRPASFVVLRDRVLWSRNTDSHEDILCEHKVAMDGVGGPNGVRVEITPPDGRWDAPPAEWVFALDQDTLPEWWDAADGEARTRAELRAWIKAKVVTAGRVEASVGLTYASGSASVVASGSASVVATDIARVEASGSARVEAWGSARVEASGSASVVAGDSASVVASGSARVVARDCTTLMVWSTGVTVKLVGNLAVAVYRTGNKARCEIGEGSAAGVNNQPEEG